MIRVLNFGSINIDHVYTVKHFVRPGETQICKTYQRFAGGKGLNQSIALAQAGSAVYHAGKVGHEDLWLKALMDKKGVDTRYVVHHSGPSGHAVIQVNDDGENTIVIVGGANQHISVDEIEQSLEQFDQGDCLLIQNETNAVPQIMQSAHAQGLTIVFNPAPMTLDVLHYPLELVDILLVNETEAQTLTGEIEPQKIYSFINRRYPQMAMVLTLGHRGAYYFNSRICLHQPAQHVQVLDSTGAGDTFIGYFLAELINTKDPKIALKCASRAAALCITRAGAAESIPTRDELSAFTPASPPLVAAVATHS